MAKRFVVFAGDDHYPLGGWRDFRNSFHQFCNAKEFARKTIDNGCDWAQVVDTERSKAKCEEGEIMESYTS